MLICWVENAIVIIDSDEEELIDEMFDDNDVCWMDIDQIVEELEELKERINDIINKLQ